MNNLPERVNSRIRPAAGGCDRADARQSFDGLLERLLHGPSTKLALPAMEVGSVVTKSQHDVPHEPIRPLLVSEVIVPARSILGPWTVYRGRDSCMSHF